ncbi:bifunctional IPC transferase and DIPP synthase [Streptomyces scabiei]|uniref:Bifunctional IPC transferase and DIPP synthase n=1 Tax=Streptomyces scabiei TaxID=1930 RepID=A0A100JMK3_STRSC|nr:bifunctional IPC transferase and DIPP synthase [Streptomyces scabiei]
MPGSSLEGDLRSLGFDVRVASDAGDAARLLATVPADQRVALVDARFVGHTHALRLGLTDPRFDAAALPGAVTVRPAARQALTRVLAREGATTSGGTAVAVDSVADRIVTGLDADGVSPYRPELGTLVAVVPDGPQARDEARRAVDAVDDEAVRLRTAVKSRDGFFTTYCISPYSRYLARWCARRGLTPNQVTTASLITALIAAGCAATGTRGGYVAAGLLLILSFVLDCTDGQLARYSLQYSTLGAWLDATFDRAKEYAYYAGLALGAARGGDDVWALALAAMVLQTCRHVVDFSFNEANHDATANTSPTAALSGKLDSVGWTVWVRRMIVLPIGERWAMIAVLTALTTPRITFYALLIGCAFAATYTTAGRVLRSLTRKAQRTDRAARALADLADSGPLAEVLARVMPSRYAFLARLLALAGAVVVVLAAWIDGPGWSVVLCAGAYVLVSADAVARPLKGPLDWLIPPLFRAAEYGTVLILAAKADVNGALPAAFGLVAAVAYHHYDTVYRIRGDAGAPPRWLVRAIGGHDGRTLLVTVLAALLAPTDFKVALTALAVAVALLVLIESIRFWVTAHKTGAPAVHDEGEPA